MGLKIKNYKNKECEKQSKLITDSDIFDGNPSGGRYLGKERPFVLTEESK